MTRREFIKKVQAKNEERIKAGLVSEHFPEVSDIVIDMTYFRKSGIPVYMKRTVNMSPSSYAHFNMSFMIKRGYDRGLDLTLVIINQIRKHKHLVKGEMVFHRQKGDPDSYLESISYQICVRYKKEQ